MNFKNNKNIFLGVTLIVIASLMFLSSFNLLPANLISQIISYTLIVYGIFQLLSRNFYASLFSIAFALKFSPMILKPYLDFNQIGYFSLFFISLLLATGLETLIGKKFRWKKKFKQGKFSGMEFSNNQEEDLTGEYVMASVNMGDSSRYITSSNLKKADLNCNLGNLDVYFLGSQLKNDLIINVNCKMGNIDIYLPKDWYVVNNIQSSLGNVDVKSNQATSEFTVYLNGNNSLGNIDVYFN